MAEMGQRAIEMVGEEGAGGTACSPARTEHEMIDDELAAPLEKLSESLLPGRRVENIGFLDQDAGQGPPLRINLVAKPRHLLFTDE